MAPRTHARRAWRRLLSSALAAGALSLVFVVALVGGVLLHLDTVPVKRLVEREVTSLLAGIFKGRVVLERIGELRLSGISGVRVRVADPEGKDVLLVDGVEIRLRTREMLRSLLREAVPLIGVERASAAHVDVSVDAAPSGNLALVDAFELRHPSPRERSNVRVELPDFKLHHAWIHGTPPGSPLVDAELRDLSLAVSYEPDAVRARLDGVNILTRGLPERVDPQGTLHGSFAMSSGGGKELAANAVFDGVVAGAPLKLEASLEGEHAELHVTMKDPSARAVRARLTGIDLEDDIDVDLRASGTLANLTAKGRITAGKATLEVEGDASLTGSRTARATARVRSVDLRAVQRALPSTDLGLDLAGQVSFQQGSEPSGTFTVDVPPGTMATQASPRIAVRGEFAGKIAHLVANVQDARMPVTLTVDTAAGPRGLRASIDLGAKVPRLGEVLQLVGVRGGGSAQVDARGTVDLPDGPIDVTVRGQAMGLAYEPVVVDEATLRAHIGGTVVAPLVAVEASAQGAWVSNFRIPSACVAAEIARSPRGVEVRDLMGTVVRRDVPVTLRAHLVSIEGPRVRAEGAVLSGLGAEVKVDVARDDDELTASFDAPAIDLSSVAKAADLYDLRGGTLSLRGMVALRAHAATGQVHALLDGFEMGELHAGHVAFDGLIDGPRIAFDGEASMKGVGKLGLHADHLIVPGNPAYFSSWMRAHGAAGISGEVDLRGLSALLPEGLVPLDAAGLITVEGNVARDGATSPPEARFHVETRGLALTVQGATKETTKGIRVQEVAPLGFEGIDIGADLALDGTTGHSEAALRLADAHGLLLAFDAKARVPYQELLEGHRPPADVLETMPVSARLVVPRRPLTTLPVWLGMRAYQGTIEADVDLGGTLVDPRASLALHAKSLLAPSARGSAPPWDVDVSGAYDGRVADAQADVRSRDRRWLRLSSRLEGSVREWLLRSPGQEPSWRASGRAEIDRLDLGNLGSLLGVRLGGKVSGNVTLDGLHEDAKLHGKVIAQGLSVGRARYSSGAATVDAEGGRFRATVRLDQADGALAAEATSGILWGKALTPSVDEAEPVDAKLSARAFRLAALLPFVRKSLYELDGRLDGEASVSFEPSSHATTMGGQLRLRDGLVQAAVFGDELRDVQGTVTLRRDGTISIDDVEARAGQGHLTARGVVTTKGLAFLRATGEVVIPKGEPVDFVLDGQPIGQIFGSLTVDVRNDPARRARTVLVDVPRLELTLPQSLKVGVQDLSRDPRIRVGTFAEPSRFVQLKLERGSEDADIDDDVSTRIDVTLGTIEVRRGRQIEIQFTGKPTVVLAHGQTEVSGRVELRGGTVDLQGKRFKVESGTITFQPEEPSNPVVVATARWDAGDGTRVFADFAGPVKNGKLTLRSEPPMSQSDIFSLILFGTTSSTSGPSTSGVAGRAAIGAGGGIATQGITDALDSFTGLQATARIDTSLANNPRPEIEVNVSPTISIRVAHVLGNPPITDPDLNLATINWRFRKNWSIETTVGDRGKAVLDAIWQKRY